MSNLRCHYNFSFPFLHMFITTLKYYQIFIQTTLGTIFKLVWPTFNSLRIPSFYLFKMFSCLHLRQFTDSIYYHKSHEDGKWQASPDLLFMFPGSKRDWNKTPIKLFKSRSFWFKFYVVCHSGSLPIHIGYSITTF